MEGTNEKSIARTLSQPLDTNKSQLPKPSEHSQRPATHTMEAPHALLQEPQWDESVASVTSHPLPPFMPTSLLQSRWDERHWH